jgi:hypothetical protein
MKRIVSFLVIILAGPGCADRVLAPAATDRAVLRNAAATVEHGRLKRPFRILFIGNSLTYVNDLPGMVEGISRAAGDEPPLEAEMVAFGGYALADHLAQGDAARAIARGGWDVVVLQQGPSTLPESRMLLVRDARRFAEQIRAVSARPALYGVWPEEERLYAFDAGIASYRAAAEAVDGLLFPAALAWKTAWRSDPAFPLYGPDRFHPSPLGTYLAALVIYAEVRDQAPVGLSPPAGITPEQARLAERVAGAVTATKPRPGKPWAERRGPHSDTFVDDVSGN